MINVRYETRFKKQYKKMIARGYDENDIRKVIHYLLSNEKLPFTYFDHKLNDSKKYKNVRECHINPDWLLIYKIDYKNNELILIATGTHSDLFK